MYIYHRVDGVYIYWLHFFALFWKLPGGHFIFVLFIFCTVWRIWIWALLTELKTSDVFMLQGLQPVGLLYISTGPTSQCSSFVPLTAFLVIVAEIRMASQRDHACSASQLLIATLIRWQERSTRTSLILRAKPQSQGTNCGVIIKSCLCRADVRSLTFPVSLSVPKSELI